MEGVTRFPSGWAALHAQVAFVARHARQPWRDLMTMHLDDFAALLLCTARMLRESSGFED